MFVQYSECKIMPLIISAKKPAKLNSFSEFTPQFFKTVFDIVLNLIRQIRTQQPTANIYKQL